jgi:hypothetical protein
MIPVLLLAALTACYAALFLPYMPNASGQVGSDYAFFFPEMLSGYFWFLKNGVLAIPWFSPAECGGSPFFPDPQSGFYTVPQFLVFAMPPLQAIQVTFLSFAVLGAIGSYWLMRDAFRASIPAATLTAALFMFNGFYVARMLAGHLTFHAYMLLPALAAALLPAGQPGRAGWVLRIGLAALILAYMVQAGMAHVLPPAILSLALVALLQAYRSGWRWSICFAAVAAGALGVCLAIANLVAWFAFLSHFPRSQYPLPGIPGLLEDVWLAFRAVFFAVPETAPAEIANSDWLQARHEWEYGITAVPLVLIVAALAMEIRHRAFPPGTAQRRVILGAMIVLLAVPIALNWYQPDWNALLKAAPFLGSSSNLLRWFSAYILIGVLLGGLSLDRLAAGRTSSRIAVGIAAAGLAGMLTINLLNDRDYYGAAGQGTYATARVQQAYAAAETTGHIPPITAIAISVDGAGQIQLGGPGNDAMTQGYSQLACYQPIFGYRLESFPVNVLRPGPVTQLWGSLLDVKNPACYVFPTANHCSPGDHFTTAQWHAASAFLDYEKLDFVLPTYARAAVWLSRLSLIGTLLAMSVAGAIVLRRPKTP